MLDDAGRDFGAGGELRKNVKIDPTDESRSGAGQARESQSDKALGLDGNITRRDFLNSSLLASGGLLLNPVSPAQLLAQAKDNSSGSENGDWTGYGGVGDYANSNGNTAAVLEAGHQIRDEVF